MNDAAAFLDSPLFVELPSLGVVSLEGNDALDFLHGQVTNQIRPLGNRAPLAGYANPQGRLFAIFRALSYKGTLHCVLPRDTMDTFVKRLRMFVLRSDVTITPDANGLKVFGTLGKGSEEFLSKLLASKGLSLPERDYAVEMDDMVVVRLADAPNLEDFTIPGPRYMIVAPSVPCEALQCDAAWWSSEIVAGVPMIFSQTMTRFVPQAINLELVRGVVFNKGCYPGQEVISRLQHIGTPSRRMMIGVVSTETMLNPGDAVYAHTENGWRQTGDILYAVSIGSHSVFLVSMPLASMDRALSIDPEGLVRVQLHQPPYAFKNVLKD